MAPLELVPKRRSRPSDPMHLIAPLRRWRER
jgi:hypothetical protein